MTEEKTYKGAVFLNGPVANRLGFLYDESKSGNHGLSFVTQKDLKLTSVFVPYVNIGFIAHNITEKDFAELLREYATYLDSFRPPEVVSISEMGKPGLRNVRNTSRK